MGLQGYVGSAEDQAKIRRLEKAREAERDRLEAVKKEAASKPIGFRNWQQGAVETAESAFKKETIGLVTREEYVQKKATIERRMAAEAQAKKRKQLQEEEREWAGKKAAREQQRKSAKLSFLDDDEDEDEGEQKASPGANNPAPAKAAAPKIVKNDEVATGFLPDAERERAMEEARRDLQAQWLAEQEDLKRSRLTVAFSYWDGSGHKRSATVAVGDTVGDFLKAARDTLTPDFPNLRNITVTNLMLVAQDVILPQACTFHKLIVGKAKNSRGEVLFDREGGPRKSHSVKVMQRHWYESNKHIYPANRWDLFDEDTHLA